MTATSNFPTRQLRAAIAAPMPPEPSKPRVSAWEWIQTILLSANLTWTTLCLGGFLAQTMIVTSLLTAALLVTYAFGAWFDRRSVHPAGFWFLPFLVYATINVLAVTPVRWLGWIDWFDWVQLVAVFWVVLNGVHSRRPQRVLFAVLLGVGAAAVWLACYQHFVQPTWLMLGRKQADQFVGRSSGPFGIPNSLAALLLLLLPAVGALALRRGASLLARVFFGWLLLVLVLGLGLTVSRGAWLGLAIALIAWPALGARVSWGKKLGLALGAAAGVAISWMIVYSSSALVHERFTQLARDAGERSRPILWKAAWQMAREHPVVGTGAGSFNVLFERFRPEGFLPNPVWAHNDYLNTLSDYGAIGFVLFFGAAVAVALIAARRGRDARQSSRRDWLGHPLVRQGLGVGLLAFAIQLFVDFHFKIPALAMAFASVAALLLSRGWPAPMTEPVAGLRRGWTVGAALLVAIVIAIGITPRYRAEALRFAARESMDRMAKSLPTESIVRSRLVDVRAQLERAVEIAPDNARAWSDLSYALVQMGRISPVDKADLLGREAEKAADRAIALCPRVAEFWVRRGGARDLQNRWAEASPDFAQAVVLSPNAVLPWYYYAYHMLLRPIGLDMGQAAVEYCLRLDPTDPDVQALRQRLATTSRSSL